jgi:phosphoribosyl 1,2-cyclic phosphate phosphodiesterase
LKTSKTAFTVTLLGTGTSQGVPVIGCDCAVCGSEDTKDQRLRAAVLLDFGHMHIVIDAGPDFRQQMLRFGVKKLDAILITHEHNDHVIGLDDVRPFNFRQEMDMPIWALPRVISELKERFSYAFASEKYPGAPGFDTNFISFQENININGIEIIPLQVMHGTLPIAGFRIGDFTYLTDMKSLTPESLEKVFGTRILVTDALHHEAHHSHMNLEEALRFVAQINPEQAYLTHVSHLMGCTKDINPILPNHVSLAHDGLVINGFY